MRRRYLLGIGLLAFAASGSGSAIAADIAARPAGAPPPVAPAFISDWSGFYIGINGGGAWANTSFEQQFFETILGVPVIATLPPNTRASGGIFGFQAGHNWQWGPVVGGLEIDFDGASLKETVNVPFATAPGVNIAATAESKLDELGSARARLGYLIFPNWLLYGTTGLGWGHFQFNSTFNESVIGIPFFNNSSSNFANEFGWVAGAGLEWKFVDHWLLRAEWLHYDFGRTTFENLACCSNFNERTSVDLVRGAISYKF
jgi:outer membrane immunogenic protein